MQNHIQDMIKPFICHKVLCFVFPFECPIRVKALNKKCTADFKAVFHCLSPYLRLKTIVVVFILKSVPGVFSEKETETLPFGNVLTSIAVAVTLNPSDTEALNCAIAAMVWANCTVSLHCTEKVAVTLFTSVKVMESVEMAVILISPVTDPETVKES